MKKLLLSLLGLASFAGYSQDTCATAVAITPGTYVIPAVDGTYAGTCWTTPGTHGEWYSYTATATGQLRVNSNIPPNDPDPVAGDDTRVSVYTGTCAALACYAGSDDVSAETGSENFLTDFTFNVTAGTTYYIQFDDRWNAGGVSFEVTLLLPDCNIAVPYTEEWASALNFTCWTIVDGNADATTWGYNNGNDFTGDGVEDPVALVFPEDITNGPKDEWLISPALALTAGTTYDVSVTYNGFDNPIAANESLATVMLDSASPTATFNQVIGQATGIVQTGTLATLKASATTSTYTFTPATSGNFHIGLHENTPQEGGILTVFGLSIVAQATAGIDDVLAGQFSVYPNPSNSVVKVSSSINAGITAVSIVDLNGRTVQQNKFNTSAVEASVNIADLATGMYMMNITSDKGTVVKKIMKN